MPDALRRALRTFLQAFLGSVLTSGVLSTVVDSGTIDLSLLQSVGVSALAAGFIALITWAMNFLEDKDVIPEVIPK